MIAIQVQIFGDKELIAGFLKIQGELGDLSEVFEEVGEEALDDIHRRMSAHPGPPLAASTINRKGHSRILRDKDELLGSFQKGAEGNVFRIGPVDADFGTSDYKAVFHQEGTSRMPRRTVIDITGEQEAKYSRIAGSALKKRIRDLGFNVT